MKTMKNLAFVIGMMAVLLSFSSCDKNMWPNDDYRYGDYTYQDIITIDESNIAFSGEIWKYAEEDYSSVESYIILGLKSERVSDNNNYTDNDLSDEFFIIRFSKEYDDYPSYGFYELMPVEEALAEVEWQNEYMGYSFTKELYPYVFDGYFLWRAKSTAYSLLMKDTSGRDRVEVINNIYLEETNDEAKYINKIKVTVKNDAVVEVYRNSRLYVFQLRGDI